MACKPFGRAWAGDATKIHAHAQYKLFGAGTRHFCKPKMSLSLRRLAQMGRQYEMNVFDALDMTTAVLPYIRKEKSGTIVMMGSRTSWRPENTCSGFYASSKAALRVFSETLASEVAQFSIRILIIEPAAFRTGALISNTMTQENLTGDPAKAMEAVVDVVRGEGKAAGRPWPLYLVLGDVGVSGVTEKCDTIKNVVERWRDVSTGLDFDPEELALHR
ncbi:hypothetical protein DFH08DRAFT_953013 [Mycena albidolilacea]|uniref:NAD(P)-binding protein n=1 Tax=Mycena albidolilacea TaxID=1033008 RepID=A0AAD7AJL9_9AGAR|nr:hypothetical protein DFH08DRAFT_953013 [Mycena albidolilacea]